MVNQKFRCLPPDQFLQQLELLPRLLEKRAFIKVNYSNNQSDNKMILEFPSEAY